MAFVAVANYTQPNFELGYALKFMRLMLLVLTAVFNLYGFVAGCILVLCFLVFNKTLSGRNYLNVKLTDKILILLIYLALYYKRWYDIKNIAYPENTCLLYGM